MNNQLYTREQLLVQKQMAELDIANCRCSQGGRYGTTVGQNASGVLKMLLETDGWISGLNLKT